MTDLSGFSYRRILAAIFIFAFLLAACAPAMTASPEREALDSAPPVAPVEMPAVSTFTVSESEGSGNFQSPPADTERLVIKNGNPFHRSDDPQRLGGSHFCHGGGDGWFRGFCEPVSSELENALRSGGDL
jgi:hypothetical protein